jgi:hypothetical protein
MLKLHTMMVLRQWLSFQLLWIIVLSTLEPLLAQRIESLILVNTVTNKQIRFVANDTYISLSEVGNKISLQANVAISPGTSSVIFDMDGNTRIRVENIKPFTLAGDTNGVTIYPSSTLAQPGVHTVSVTPYSSTRGTGKAGSTYTIQFTTITSHVSNPDIPIHCQCSSCTDDIWNQIADVYSCGARITWVMNTLGKSERDACIQVSTEFPTICGVGCNSATCSASPQAAPVIHSPVFTPTAPVQSSKNKCGAAVNTGETSSAICTRDLWNPTGDTSQHCFAYGGPSDPCAIHNNNDVGDGLFKNPSACAGDTFYLWDEPDTQGKDYAWAGIEWANYATRFANEIKVLRARGVKFTSPLLRAGSSGAIITYLNTFYTACGPSCHDPQSPAYININAINAFVGSWNDPGIDGCRDGAKFITNEVINYNDKNSDGSRPWYITNWSRLGTYNTIEQVDAMNVIDEFFVSGSPVQRIYWFGATDYGGNSGNNFLTTQVTTTSGDTKTLGQIWEAKCKTL